jgi:spermidine synthase
VKQSRSTIHWSDFTGLGLASAATLALQVTATRLFSFLIWYHFAFLVLSIAFLGFTAGGLFVATAEQSDPHKSLSKLGIAGGLTGCGVFVALEFLPLEPLFLNGVGPTFVFIVAVLLLLVPFACLGAYICLALSVWSEHIGPLYAVNLGGSAAGCGVVVLLLEWLGVPAAFFASAFMAFASGLLQLRFSRSKRWGWPVVAVAVGAWLTLISMATNELSPLFYIKSAKAYPHLPRELVAERRSDSLSSVEIFAGIPDITATLWGLSPAYHGPIPDLVGFAIDGWALTASYRRPQMEVADSVIDYLPAALPYRVHKAKDALVIGAGGGLDILTALHYGATHVTGVEINPIILDSVRNTYADFAGHLYQDPRVEMHQNEGRHYLKRDPRKYDLIQLSGVDTFAASQAGAFSLHENYLYTVEAMHDYLNALKPDGLLTFTRWLYSPPRQTLRLAAIADRALRERGVERPQNHIVVFGHDVYSVVLIKNDEFSPEEVASIQRDVESKQYSLIYAPHVRVNPFKEKWGDKNPFYELWDRGPDKYIADYQLDISPSTDDRPFFFEYQRWGHVLASDKVFHTQNAQNVLSETLLLCGVLCALLMWLARRRFRGVPVSLGRSAHVYFSALGLAYIFVENVLVQRIILFLGSPVYALTVIMLSLLAWSGFGSMLVARSRLLRERIGWAMCAAAALLVIYSLALRPVLDALLGLPLSLRVIIVLVVVAPLGTLMGMPFPVAIAQLTAAEKRLVPWAWVINGAASVLGSVLAVIMAMTSGFSAVFWAAAALYLVAAWVHRNLVPEAVASPVIPGRASVPPRTSPASPARPPA